MLGFLNIDKPLNLTSHDVVARVRRAGKRFGVTKVGHAGTLDPLATGVLVICLGGATRLSEYVMGSRKGYRALIRLGVETETYDAEGAVVSMIDPIGVTKTDVEAALAQFTGAIDQVPPMYSAIKQGGRKLYDLARAGEVVERPARAVTIDSLTIIGWQMPLITLAVTCSAGTYIRSLAHDLGAALGVGAHLAGLTRTRSGGFHLETALTLDSVLAQDDWHSLIVPPEQALADWQQVRFTEQDAAALRSGRRVPAAQGAPLGTLALALTDTGRLIGVIEAVGGEWQPRRMVHDEDE